MRHSEANGERMQRSAHTTHTATWKTEQGETRHEEDRGEGDRPKGDKATNKAHQVAQVRVQRRQQRPANVFGGLERRLNQVLVKLKAQTNEISIL